MQSESHSEYLKICNEYNVTLNKVNLLLVKEHSYRTQKQQYQQQIETINKFITELQQFEENKNTYSSSIVIQKQHKYLQEIIYQNKTQLLGLQRKLESKELLIKQLSNINTLQQKYGKLLTSDYQSSLQQKLSMIRGKVDDLKKKIKQINKDILSIQQQHKQLMDQYSYKCNCLNDYKMKNKNIKDQIQILKEMIKQKTKK